MCRGGDATRLRKPRNHNAASPQYHATPRHHQSPKPQHTITPPPQHFSAVSKTQSSLRCGGVLTLSMNSVVVHSPPPPRPSDKKLLQHCLRFARTSDLTFVFMPPLLSCTPIFLLIVTRFLLIFFQRVCHDNVSNINTLHGCGIVTSLRPPSAIHVWKLHPVASHFGSSRFDSSLAGLS